MIKRIVLLLLVAVTPVFAGHANDDDFDFDSFAISDSVNADITTESHTLNPGAMPVAVSNFDIAGIMLGMPFESVVTLFADGGLYSPRANDAVVYTITPDWRYNLDYECQQQNIFVPEQLEQCVRTLAKNRGLMYASEYHLVRELTGETIDVYFTSNATDNTVWRIEYNNDVNELVGDAEKFEDQRQKKILSFWSGVLDKYGTPNSGTDTWVTSNNAYDPMMIAYYGALELVDNGRYATDAAKNVTDARVNFPAKPYAF
ncbi:MAG: hypothetical protein J5679_02820 [Alphaproteobacteria bacterium]|nr:hypothetical protein [Alphaproteobacteria bacterium]